MEDESIQSFHLIYFIKLRRLSAVSHKMMNCVLLFYDFICFLWSVTTMKMKRTRRFLSPVLLWPRAERDFVSWSESLFFLFNKVVVSRDESLLYFHHAHHVRRLIPGLLLRCSQTTDRVNLVWGQFIRELTHSVSLLQYLWLIEMICELTEKKSQSTSTPTQTDLYTKDKILYVGAGTEVTKTELWVWSPTWVRMSSSPDVMLFKQSIIHLVPQTMNAS